MGFSKSSAKGTVHSNSSLPQEQEKNQIKLPNFTSKATRKRRRKRTPGLVEGKK